MFTLMAISSFVALLFVYVFMPALWASFAAVDDSLDAHEAGLALVASRNPFRESGPPANMAKLILLRHKIQTSNRRRRNASQVRQASRIAVAPRPKGSWIHFGRPLGGKIYH